MNNQSVLLVTLLALNACGGSPEQPPPAMQVKDTVFAPTVQSLDKARAVQDTLQQGQDQANAAIEAATQTGE